MAVCNGCHAYVDDKANFCPNCGMKMEPKQNTASGSFYAEAQYTYSTRADDTDNRMNKVMAVLSYLGLLVLVPILTTRYSSFVRFHANQGLVLLIVKAIYIITSAIILASWFAAFGPFGYFIAAFLYSGYLGLVALSVFGIICVAKGREVAFPIIGWIRILR